MPHDVPRAAERRRVTIVGAGPAGLEAARVAAERGHDVTVFEAADEPGGQVRLTARQDRRREMISIISWRMAMCEKRGVRFRFNTLAEAGDPRTAEQMSIRGLTADQVAQLRAILGVMLAQEPRDPGSRHPALSPSAEEIAQDAFVALHRRWDDVQEGRGPAYLRQCVVNGARSALRHHKVEQRYLDSLKDRRAHPTRVSAEDAAISAARARSPSSPNPAVTVTGSNPRPSSLTVSATRSGS